MSKQAQTSISPRICLIVVGLVTLLQGCGGFMKVMAPEPVKESRLFELEPMPVDILKIDKSFVDGLGTNPDDSAIVKAIIGLAHTMGLTALAENEHASRVGRATSVVAPARPNELPSAPSTAPPSPQPCLPRKQMP